MSLPRGWYWFGWLLIAHVVGCASVPKPAATTPPPTSANAGTTTIVAIQPSSPACDTTLPKFLGLDAAAQGIGGGLQRLGSRLMSSLDLTGRFPGLQPQPPVLPLTAPENMGPEAPPAVQAAADIKKEEDSAPQKIMAIRYLATLGCGGCYEKVEEALLEGLGDCTESVRYEAVRALQCKPECGCRYCSSPSCCSANVRKKLEELTRCEKEPSARIRRHARLALACCMTKPLEQEDAPREGPTPAAASLDGESVAAGGEPDLFDGIQKVSFQAPKSDGVHDGVPDGKGGNERVLAVVNGEAIMRSQIEGLLDSEGDRSLLTGSPRDEETRLRIAVEKAVNWKIIEQQVRSEVRLAGGNTSNAVAPDEMRAWFAKRSSTESYVSASEIAAFYEVHRPRFSRPSRVRWEELVVYVSECGTKANAIRLAETLRRRAEGYEASPGMNLQKNQFDTNSYPWMTTSSVGSVALAKCLESLPVGQVSPIIEDDGRLIVLRVLERVPSEVRSLADCASEIQEQILAERKQQAERNLLAQLRAASSVRTVLEEGTAPDRNPVQMASKQSIEPVR
ncbi:peptidyl-prolyl cis-trans isomerase [Pirellulaceae bacterium SH467]